MFYIISVLVPLIACIAVTKAVGDVPRLRWLLVIAWLTFAASYHMPSPQIHGMDTAFFTHFFGGGMFTGLVGVYILRAKGWQLPWWLEVAALYGLVCAFGVGNELFELALYYEGYMPQGVLDTSWDLLANTLGAGCFYIGYRLAAWQRSL